MTAAKYLLSKSALIAETIGIEYAERAIRENPDSVEAMNIWVNCHPSGQQLSAYKEMLSKFPNYAGGHELIAHFYFYDFKETELAIEYMQKAMLLDSRIKGHLLGRCYYKIGEYEKAIAIYQGLPEIKSADLSYLISIIQDKQAEDL